MYHNFFIYLCVEGHLGCFHIVAIVNSAAVNIGVHVSFSIMISSGCMPSSGIVGAYGCFIPGFLRSLHIVLLSGYITLPSHQQGKRVSFLFFDSITVVFCGLSETTTSLSLAHCPCVGDEPY